MDLPPLRVLLEVAAAGGGAGLVLLAALPWRERAWPAPVAVASGYALGEVLARGTPGLAPADATRYLLHVAAAAGALGVAEGARGLPPAARWGLRAAGAAGAAWLVLFRLPAPGLAETAACAGGALALWSLLAFRAPPARALGLAVTAAAGGAALVLARTALLGQLAGAAAAALAAVAALSRGPGRSLAPLGALLLPSLWVLGHLLAELPAWSAVLLSAAPLLAFGPWWLAGLLPAFPAGAAVWLAYAANPPSGYGY